MGRLSNLLSGLRELLKFDNPAALLTNRLFFRKQGLVVYQHKGMEFLVDHQGGDQHGTRACLTGDMYSRHFSLLPKNHPLNVLDLGANGGGLALSLTAAGYKIDRLGCVEMNPHTFLRLHFNIHRNLGFTRRTLLHAAAYKEDGEITVTLGLGSTGDSLYSSTQTPGQPVQVPTKCLNTLIIECFGDEPIDLCKIDIEGAEYDLFEGPCQKFSQVRMLIIEIHPHATGTPQSLIQQIQDLGFEENAQAATTDGTCAVHLFHRKH